MLLNEAIVVFSGGMIVGGLCIYDLLLYWAGKDENKKLKREQIGGLELWQNQQDSKKNGQSESPPPSAPCGA
jgi:hypothetical protein